MRVAVLTGAGCSTESGIPDYRSDGTTRRAKNPVQYRAFVSDANARARYWARSMLGWPRFSRAAPNAAHSALTELERRGVVHGIITQNVDRLHTVAGARRVIELHGALADVRCLACGTRESRESLQQRLVALNPEWLERDIVLNPDGDAELDAHHVADFRVAPCVGCGSDRLKPDVVFFGETVPPTTVSEAYALVAEADALLVVGSSLAVFSGFRFVRRAADSKQLIAIINLSATRGDALADVRISAPAGRALPYLLQRWQP
jgi:NAD-dependent SIR2 family protein deacetylase